MRSGYHALWDAHMDLLFRESLIAQMRNTSREFLEQYEAAVVKRVEEIKDALAPAFGELVQLMEQAGGKGEPA